MSENELKEVLARLEAKVDEVAREVKRVEDQVKKIETNDLPHLKGDILKAMNERDEKLVEMLRGDLEASAKGTREHIDGKLNEVLKRLPPV